MPKPVAFGLQCETGHSARRSRRCIAFITSGDSAPETVREVLLALEARKRDLEGAMTIQDEPVVELHPNLPQLYERKVANLLNLLKDETNRMDAMDAIRGLIERIEVSRGRKRGDCDVTLVGALAAILAFPQNETRRPGGRRWYVLVGCGGRI